jgi:hypothetical protein
MFYVPQGSSEQLYGGSWTPLNTSALFTQLPNKSVSRALFIPEFRIYMAFYLDTVQTFRRKPNLHFEFKVKVINMPT